MVHRDVDGVLVLHQRRCSSTEEVHLHPGCAPRRGRRYPRQRPPFGVELRVDLREELLHAGVGGAEPAERGVRGEEAVLALALALPALDLGGVVVGTTTGVLDPGGPALMQLFGTWLRMPVVGVALPVPLFVPGHGPRLGRRGRRRRLRPVPPRVESGGSGPAVVVHVANSLPLLLASPPSRSSSTHHVYTRRVWSLT